MSYQRQISNYILQQIEYVWHSTGVTSEFIELLHLALPSLGEESAPEKNPAKWALLPGLCCQAAGGDPSWLEPLSAAWFLYYVAAHIMDQVEDQDMREGRWKELGMGTSINVASGLYFSASLLLTELRSRSFTSQISDELIREFYLACLRMCDGQNRDLTIPSSSLSEYWKQINGKSGIFFSMACRLGARVATSDTRKLDSYGDFGRCIGVLIQVLDDLEEFQDSGKELGKISFPILRRSLPIIYAMEVLPEDEASQLHEELVNSTLYPASGEAAFRRIENSGAAFYIITEIEHLRRLAVSSLEAAHPSQPAAGILSSYLESLTYQY